jgi:hypothetical protein
VLLHPVMIGELQDWWLVAVHHSLHLLWAAPAACQHRRYLLFLLLEARVLLLPSCVWVCTQTDSSFAPCSSTCVSLRTLLQHVRQPAHLIRPLRAPFPVSSECLSVLVQPACCETAACVSQLGLEMLLPLLQLLNYQYWAAVPGCHCCLQPLHRCPHSRCILAILLPSWHGRQPL